MACCTYVIEVSSIPATQTMHMLRTIVRPLRWAWSRNQIQGSSRRFYILTRRRDNHSKKTTICDTRCESRVRSYKSPPRSAGLTRNNPEFRHSRNLCIYHDTNTLHRFWQIDMQSGKAVMPQATRLLFKARCLPISSMSYRQRNTLCSCWTFVQTLRNWNSSIDRVNACCLDMGGDPTLSRGQINFLGSPYVRDWCRETTCTMAWQAYKNGSRRSARLDQRMDSNG